MARAQRGNRCLGLWTWHLSGFGFNAGCDHGNAHDALQIFIKGRAKDDICVRIHFFPDTVCSFVDFEQGHVRTAGDVDQHAPRAGHRHIFQQRIGNRAFRGHDGAVVAFRFARSHHCLAHFAHYRANIGEVQIDQARHDHQVGDAANA